MNKVADFIPKKNLEAPTLKTPRQQALSDSLIPNEALHDEIRFIGFFLVNA